LERHNSKGGGSSDNKGGSMGRRSGNLSGGSSGNKGGCMGRSSDNKGGSMGRSTKILGGIFDGRFCERNCRLNEKDILNIT